MINYTIILSYIIIVHISLLSINDNIVNLYNFAGAIAGILVGAAVDIAWLVFLAGTGIYEILPGALAGLIAAVIVTLLTKKPSADVEALYDKAISFEEK